MGGIIRALGAGIKVVAGPLSAGLNLIPHGHATGTGVVAILAGLAVQFAVGHGWIPGDAAPDLTAKVAAAVTAVGVVITAWGDGRSRGATSR